MDGISFSNDGTTKSDRKIHTPSSFARSNLNFVQEVGVLRSLKSHSCIRENLDSYLFFTCLEGSGSVKTGGKTYIVRAGECVLLDCRKHYEHVSSENDPWKIMWVHCNGREIKAYYPLFEEGNSQNPVFMPKDGADEYLAILEELKNLPSEKMVINEIHASMLLSRLFFLCLNDVVDGNELSIDHEAEFAEDDFASLRESVNEHCDEESLMRILSIQYGLEDEQLSDLFLKKYGISLDEYIINRRFNKAKELLRFTIKPVEEIARESGINDMDKFKELFMSNEEMSPEDYRKKWAQWIKS